MSVEVILLNTGDPSNVKSYKKINDNLKSIIGEKNANKILNRMEGKKIENKMNTLNIALVDNYLQEAKSAFEIYKTDYFNVPQLKKNVMNYEFIFLGDNKKLGSKTVCSRDSFGTCQKNQSGATTDSVISRMLNLDDNDFNRYYVYSKLASLKKTFNRNISSSAMAGGGSMGDFIARGIIYLNKEKDEKFINEMMNSSFFKLSELEGKTYYIKCEFSKNYLGMTFIRIPYIVAVSQDILNYIKEQINNDNSDYNQFKREIINQQLNKNKQEKLYRLIKRYSNH